MFSAGQSLAASQILERGIEYRKPFPATIKQIGKLIGVAAQVLFRNPVERAVDSAL